MLKNMGLRQRVVACLLFFGLLPALIIYSMSLWQSKSVEKTFQHPLLLEARSMMNIIDRNLYERMGDVQAFTINGLVRDPAQWTNPSSALVPTIDQYMGLYGLYDAMMVLDKNGVVRAMNTKDIAGKPLKGPSLVGQSLAQESWFKKTIAGESLKNTSGQPSGTYVEGPARSPILDKIYKSQDGYALVYTSVIKDFQGNIIGIWANFCNPKFIEDFLSNTHKEQVASGRQKTDMILLDKAGNIILEYDGDKTPEENAKRNFSVLGKVNLVKMNVPTAKLVVGGKTGTSESYHARKKVKKIDGYAHSTGYIDYAGLGWSMLVRADPDEVNYSLNIMKHSMLITIILSLIFISAVGLYVGKKFAGTIGNIADVMKRIASGQKGLSVPYQDDKTEIGQMAQACEFFKDVMIEADRMNAEQKKQGENARIEIKQKMLSLTDEIEREMHETISQVLENAKGVLIISEELSVSSKKVSQESMAVSHATESAQMNVESVAAATEELSISVNEISQQVSHAASVTQSAVTSANDTNATVQKLADAVRSVGDVVLLISDIAEQTNLLALNATIEAARAGEAGKGFAVVAAEVKNLANQTTKATDGITGQITAIQKATQSSVTAIESIVKTIQDIDNISSSIAAAVEEQGAATNEISANTQQASQGTRVVSEKIVGVNKEFQRTNELSSQVKTMTDDVMGHVQGLRDRMVEILRNSYAGDRRENIRYKADNFTIVINSNGKSYPCDVRDISSDGVAAISKDLGSILGTGSVVTLDISGYTQTLDAKICGIGNGELLRIMFLIDEKKRLSMERFLKARFEGKAEVA